MQSPIAFIKNLTIKILKDDCMGLSSEIAFNMLLSLFPFMLVLFAILALSGNINILYQINSVIKVILPTEAFSLIEKILRDLLQTPSHKILTLSFIGAIWTSSNAALSLIKSLNKIYNIKKPHHILISRLLSILILITSSSIIIIGSNLVIFSKIIINFLAGINPVIQPVSNIILLIRWPIAFISLFSLVLIIYYIVSESALHKNFLLRIKESLPGTTFFCIFWLIASSAFSIYVDNFGRYNAIYGSLGAFIILMLWLYYTALIILIGGEINSILGKK